MQGLMVVGFIVDEILRVGLTRNWLQARLSVYPPQNYLKLANNFLSQTCKKFVKDIFSAL